jgi:DNA invertase Pin-like site-specific DNA recombinase
VTKTPATTLRIITCSASSALCEAPHKAEFERDLIRARTGEGRERAKARGVKMGRKPKLTPHQQAEAIKHREAGEPMRDIGKSFNVSHSTISRLTA